MKKIILFSILCISISSYSKIIDSNTYLKLFDKIQKNEQHDLGVQCSFINKTDVEANELKIDDDDLTISYEDFFSKIKKNGLLSQKRFINPKSSNSDKNTALVAIDSIESWTDHYIESKLADSKEKCFLNAKEIFSLFYYTGEGYRSLNEALRTGDQNELRKFSILNKHLISALDKLKPYQGYVKRGYHLDPNDKTKVEAFNKKYDPNANVPITLEAYTSTTIASPFPGEVQLVMQTKKNCRYIADFSLVEQKDSAGVSYREEEEVLCKPNTQFKVLFHQTDGVNHKIILEEI